MAVRIHQTRRRRRVAQHGTDVADVTSMGTDPSGLLEAVDHVLDQIDEATRAG
jgi:hypothetical protein